MNRSISESEWKIMQALWEKPNSNLCEIVSSLNDANWSYSTIKTMLNRLVNKGFVRVDKTIANCFRYEAVVKEQEHKMREARTFIQKVFDGSVLMFVSTLARDSKLSEKEQEELMRIISKMEDN